jgi:hypothetical protein
MNNFSESKININRPLVTDDLSESDVKINRPLAMGDLRAIRQLATGDLPKQR